LWLIHVALFGLSIHDLHVELIEIPFEILELSSHIEEIMLEIAGSVGNAAKTVLFELVLDGFEEIVVHHVKAGAFPEESLERGHFGGRKGLLESERKGRGGMLVLLVCLGRRDSSGPEEASIFEGTKGCSLRSRHPSALRNPLP
jgi:hypothetical protein